MSYVSCLTFTFCYFSQLFYDGYQAVALNLNNLIAPDPPCPPSDRLFSLVTEGLKFEKEMLAKKQESDNYLDALLGPGLDLELDTDIDSNAPEPSMYVTAYVTSHKAPCRSAAFSSDGQLVATGSVDASIKVYISYNKFIVDARGRSSLDSPVGEMACL